MNNNFLLDYLDCGQAHFEIEFSKIAIVHLEFWKMYCRLMAFTMLTDVKNISADPIYGQF
jgi:hypothetical protein